VLLRGVYGILAAILTHVTGAHRAYYTAIATLLGSSIAQYFVWTWIFLVYIPSIAIPMLLNAKKRFDVYFRGMSVYFSLFILTHILIAS